MGANAVRDIPLPGSIRRGLCRSVRCGLTLAILLAAAASWATTYRWVDEQGRVHYGDSLPPQYAGKGHVEMNAQGRVTKRVERAFRTAEERQRQEDAARRQAAEQRQAREQARRDSALLASYGSEREIDRARDRALEQERLLLDSLLMMSGQNLSVEESAHVGGMILKRRRNMEDIRARYEADKLRYRQLTTPP